MKLRVILYSRPLNSLAVIVATAESPHKLVQMMLGSPAIGFSKVSVLAGPRVPAEKILENGLDQSGYRMKLHSSYARTSYTLLLLRCNVMQLKIEVNIKILSATSR
jgi:hypothetical protein